MLQEIAKTPCNVSYTRFMLLKRFNKSEAYIDAIVGPSERRKKNREEKTKNVKKSNLKQARNLLFLVSEEN